MRQTLVIAIALAIAWMPACAAESTDEPEPAEGSAPAEEGGSSTNETAPSEPDGQAQEQEQVNTCQPGQASCCNFGLQAAPGQQTQPEKLIFNIPLAPIGMAFVVCVPT